MLQSIKSPSAADCTPKKLADAIVEAEKAKIEERNPSWAFTSYGWDNASELFKKATASLAPKRWLLEPDAERRGFPPFRLKSTMYGALAKHVQKAVSEAAKTDGKPEDVSAQDIAAMPYPLREAAQSILKK